MDPARNPFAPGAGTPPPELAGRDPIIADVTIALERIKSGRPAKGFFLLGLRGVGKTVLLNRLREVAEGLGYAVVQIEAPENRRLAEMLVPELRKVLLRIDSVENARALVRKGLSGLRSFASAFKVRFGDLEFGVEKGQLTAMSGNLESDLPELFSLVGKAAQAVDRPVAILADEIQYLNEEDLGALLVAAHRMAQQKLPVIVMGAGLPLLAGMAGNAKSYAERLFDFRTIGPLDSNAAKNAIRQPVLKEKVRITDEALTEIVKHTQGYPYFLQEWGSHAWNVATESPISADDVEVATRRAIADLDDGFFRVRVDRLTPRERDYLRAMAELGPGPHRSGDIAAALGTKVTAVAPLRDSLIQKGMIYSPSHGDTAFTVPMFEEYLKRTISDWVPAQTRSDKKLRTPRKRSTKGR